MKFSEETVGYLWILSVGCGGGDAEIPAEFEIDRAEGYAEARRGQGD